MYLDWTREGIFPISEREEFDWIMAAIYGGHFKIVVSEGWDDDSPREELNILPGVAPVGKRGVTLRCLEGHLKRLKIPPTLLEREGALMAACAAARTVTRIKPILVNRITTLKTRLEKKVGPVNPALVWVTPVIPGYKTRGKYPPFLHWSRSGK